MHYDRGRHQKSGLNAQQRSRAYGPSCGLGQPPEQSALGFAPTAASRTPAGDASPTATARKQPAVLRARACVRTAPICIDTAMNPFGRASAAAGSGVVTRGWRARWRRLPWQRRRRWPRRLRRQLRRWRLRRGRRPFGHLPAPLRACRGRRCFGAVATPATRTGTGGTAGAFLPPLSATPLRPSRRSAHPARISPRPRASNAAATAVRFAAEGRPPRGRRAVPGGVQGRGAPNRRGHQMDDGTAGAVREALASMVGVPVVGVPEPVGVVASPRGSAAAAASADAASVSPPSTAHDQDDQDCATSLPFLCPASSPPSAPTPLLLLLLPL